MTNIMSVVNEESQSQTSFASFLTEFTKKIDQYETCDWKTSNHVHSHLWDDFSWLRREIANNKNEHESLNLQPFSDWKYKDSFELTEKNHEDHQQLFKDLPWEESFVLAFLYFIYH
jgi:hypothetical protein